MNESNLFKINKTKNHITILLLSIIFLIFIVLSLNAQNYFALIMIVAYSIYGLYKASIEYKAEILINATGIQSKRNGQMIQMNWKNIKTIHIREGKRFPMFDCMIIEDLKGQKIYIDYNIKDYNSAWNHITTIAKSGYQNILFVKKKK